MGPSKSRCGHGLVGHLIGSGGWGGCRWRRGGTAGDRGGRSKSGCPRGGRFAGGGRGRGPCNRTGRARRVAGGGAGLGDGAVEGERGEALVTLLDDVPKAWPRVGAGSRGTRIGWGRRCVDDGGRWPLAGRFGGVARGGDVDARAGAEGGAGRRRRPSLRRWSPRREPRGARRRVRIDHVPPSTASAMVRM